MATVLAVSAGAQQSGERLLQSAHSMLGRNLNAQAADEYREAADALRDKALIAEANYGLGVALYRQGELPEAIDALRNIRPRVEFAYRTDADMLLATILAEQGASADALRVVARCLGETSHASWPDAASLAVDLSYREGEHAEAVAYFAEFDGQLSAASPELWSRAALFAGLAMYEVAATPSASAHAAELLERAASSTADAATADYASLAAAGAWTRADQQSHAERVYSTILHSEVSGVRSKARIAIAGLFRSRQKPEQAIAVLEPIDPDSLGARTAADFHFELGLARFDTDTLELASESLDQVLRSEAGHYHAMAGYWRAKADLRGGNAEAAADRLRRIVRRDNESPITLDARYDLGVALHRLGRLDDAAEVFRALRTDAPDSRLAKPSHFAELTIAVSQERLDDAATLATAFLSTHPKSQRTQQVSVLLAESLFERTHYEDAIASAHLALESSDTSLAARATLVTGLSHRALGDSDAAHTHLSAACTILGNTAQTVAARVALAEIAFEREEWSAALDELSHFISSPHDEHPQRRRALLLTGLAQARLARHDDAITTLRAVGWGASTDEVAAHAKLELAELYRQVERREDAIEVLSSLVDSQPQSRYWPHATRLLASLVAETGDAAAAINLYTRAAASDNPDVAAASRLEQARLLLAIGDAQGAADALEGTQSPDGMAVRLIAMSRTGEHATALTLATHLDLREIANDLAQEVRFYSAESLRHTGKLDEAAKTYESLVESDVVGLEAAYRLAELSIARDDLDYAATVLEEATRARRPMREQLCASVLYQLAWCRHSLGDPASAIAVLDDANCDFGSLRGQAARLRGEALSELSRHAEASASFASALTNQLPDEHVGPTLLRLGESAAAAQDWEASVDAFTRHRAHAPESERWFIAEFGIGWAREHLNDHRGAMKHYGRVVDDHEGSTAARAQFQLGECLFALGRHEDAIREFLRVDTMHAESEWNAAALYEAGRCFEAINKIGEARSQYRHVMSAHAESAWAEASRERLDAIAGPGGARSPVEQ
ncbi:MAG: tetratricopeptide repeat protein [Planctomycetota bacterium]